jgi:hypothetical protein
MFIRVECRDALKTAIEGATEVPVLKGFETPDPSNERIHLDATSGTVSYDVFIADALPRDDRFSIDVYVYTAVPGRTQAQAEERAQELMNAVDEALADANFNDLTLDTAFVFTALLGTVDGPHTAPIEEGFEAFAMIEVAVHTRSTYR